MRSLVRVGFGIALATLCMLVGAASPKGAEFFERAFAILKAGDVEVAIGMFEKGLEEEPNNGLAHFYLGAAYEASKTPNDAKALEHYTKAAALLPLSPDQTEASVRAQRLRAKLAKLNLRSNPGVLGGRWCYTDQFGPGVLTIIGNDIYFKQGNSNSSGKLTVLDERRFLLKIRAFLFASFEDIYELVDENAIRQLLRDGNPMPDETPMRRC